MSKNRMLGKLDFHSMFSKLLISYALIAVFITSILSGLLYYAFRNTALNVIEANSKERLSQNMNHLSLIRSRVFSLGLQLLEDGEIRKAVFGDGTTPVEKAFIDRKITNIINSDSIIQSICLYNSRTREAIDSYTSDSRDPLLGRMLQILADYDPANRHSFIPSVVDYKTATGFHETKRFITVVFTDSAFLDEKEDKQASLPSTSAILINLDADAIQGSISSFSGEQKEEMIVADKNGTVVFDSQKQNFGTHISERENVRVSLASRQEKGSLIQDVRGEKSLIVHASLSTPGWTFINVYKFKDLFSEINRLGLVIVLICAAILVLAFVFSVITARRIYSPFRLLLDRVSEQTIAEGRKNTGAASGKPMDDAQYLIQSFNSIMKKVAKLESSISNNLPMLKKSYAKKAVSSSYKNEPEFVIHFEELFENFVPKSGKGSLTVLVFSFPSCSELMMSSLEILIAKLISEWFPCEPVDHDRNEVCLIVRMDRIEPGRADFQNAIHKVQESMQTLLGQTPSCAAGFPVGSIQDIHLSYSSAIDLIKYQFVYGYGVFFTHDMEELSDRVPFVSIEKIKEKLIQSIKMCDTESVEAALDTILQELSCCQYDYLMLALNSLMLDIVTAMEAFYERESEKSDFNNIYCNLNQVTTLDEMKMFFLLYCKGVIEKIEWKKANKKSEMVHEMLQYIEENYHKYDISTEFLAGMVNRTPGYFGKLFKENVGSTVNEYIIHLRLSKAQELLKSTNLSIYDISAKVGFNNYNYFTTLFRKSFGITPNQFRSDSMAHSLKSEPFEKK